MMDWALVGIKAGRGPVASWTCRDRRWESRDLKQGRVSEEDLDACPCRLAPHGQSPMRGQTCVNLEGRRPVSAL